MKQYALLANAASVPLAEEDHHLLMTIYGARKRLLIAAYTAMLPVMAYYSSLSFPSEKEMLVSADLMILINFLCIFIPVTIVIIIIYRKRIGCFKQDADGGVKYIIPHLVVNKQYFPITDQYFLGLDDPDYMNHEVDTDTFNSVQEGDTVPIYFARRSRYAFNMNGSFSMM